MIEFDKYIWEEDTVSPPQNKYLIVVIYDISQNKDRYKLVKVLEKYGYRVQKSAFECLLNKKQFEKLKKDINSAMNPEDSVKIYRLKGVSEVLSLGKSFEVKNDEIIII